MRKLILHAAFIIFALGMEVPSHAAPPQVCRGHDEGFEVFTDCYGMSLTGIALRNAQIRELEQSQTLTAEIAAYLGVSILKVPASHAACPSGSVRLSLSYRQDLTSEPQFYCVD